MRKIIFRGKEYARPDEMPPEVRRAYDETMRAFADEDRSGVPDLFEGKGNVDVRSTQVVQTFELKDVPGALQGTAKIVFKKIVFNGKEYSSPDEMPPEVRRAYDETLQLFADKDQSGIPDVFEGKEGVGLHHSQVQLQLTGVPEALQDVVRGPMGVGKFALVVLGAVLLVIFGVVLGIAFIR